MTFSCEEIQDSLLFHLEGEETGIPPASIEEHLSSCAQCRERAESIKALNGLLGALPAKTRPESAASESSLSLMLMKTPKKRLPQNFEDKVLSAIRREKRPTLQKVAGRKEWRLVQSLAAAVIVMFISFIGYQSMDRPATYENYLKIEASIDKPLYFINMAGKKTVKDRRTARLDSMESLQRSKDSFTSDSSPSKVGNRVEGESE